MNLDLSNGTTILDADRKLLRFMDNEYELYDGIPTDHDSTLSLKDILISIMMNSRLDTADKVKSIWDHKDKTEEALSRISPSVSLEDDDIPSNDLKRLFAAFCEVPWVGQAVATKILHRKRPKLIPIYDSVVGNYILKSHSIKLKRGSSEADYLYAGVECFRKQLRDCIDEVEKLQKAAEDEGYHLSPVRILEVLIWIENEDNGYYQICPNCRKQARPHVIPIRYGTPTPWLKRLEGKNEIILKDGIRSPTSPKFHCNGCRTDWGQLQ